MKIALITDGIHPFVLGGMQKHSYYLAKHLATLKVEVTVYHCPNHKLVNYNDAFTIEELAYLSFVEIPFPDEIKMPGHYIRASKKYSKLILDHLLKSNQAYDFIYAKGFTARSLLKHKKRFNCPIAVQLHGLEMFQKGGGAKQVLEKELLKPITKKVLTNADYIFTYGGKIKEILIANGVLPEQIVIQHGAADEMWLTPLSPAKKTNNNFLFVGRFEHRKAHHLINELVTGYNDDYCINMVGEVPLSARVTDTKVIYHGNCNPDEIKEMMQNNTFLLIPSLAEGFPTIIVEAMAQGLIPLATKVGAVEEIVNEKNGILFNPGDLDDLQKSIQKAISLPNSQKEVLAKNARMQVEKNFNWHQTALVLLNDIKNCIDNWKRTHS